MKKQRTGSILLHDTRIGIWEESVDEQNYMAVYMTIITHLRLRGFRVIKDPDTKKHYKILSPRHHYARKGDLEANLSLSGRCIEVEFYQNMNHENSNGGRYDFDKYNRMPYPMKKQFINETSYLLERLVNTYGYTYSKALAIANGSETTRRRVIKAIDGTNPVANPLARFNDMWGPGRFKRGADGWPVPSEFDHGPNRDREGVPLRNGMFRYWRDRSGYLKRGTIYTNMNSMWQIIYGPGRRDTTWVSSSELFSLQAEDSITRAIPERERNARLKKYLGSAVKAMDFERAAKIRDILYGKDSKEAA